jgi:ABC-type multidrug transport system ATPase subunit
MTVKEPPGSFQTANPSADNEPVRPRLIVFHGGQKWEYSLDKAEISLGWDSQCDIVLPYKGTVKVQARLRWTDQGFEIETTGPVGSLLYRGQGFQRRLLKNGDQLRIKRKRLYDPLISLLYQDQPQGQVVPGQEAPVMATSLNLGEQVVTIGRGAENKLVLGHPLVSRHHAILYYDNAKSEAYLKDLGSFAGTFANGQRLKPFQPVAIQEDQQFQVAGYVLVLTGRDLISAGAVITRLDALNLYLKVEPAQKLLLENVSISIQAGEMVALVGESGAGKSSLMKGLNGVQPVTHGRVLVNNQDFYRNFGAYRVSLGYVPQAPTIHEELSTERALRYIARLRLPADTSRQEIEAAVYRALADVDLSKHHLTRISRLSGGEKKRLTIAAELLAESPLFFLDEPTSGLDPFRDKEIMWILRKLADQGRIIVLVTHANENIELCDKVAFLAAGGKLCFYGSPAEALTFFEAARFSDIYEKVSKPRLAVFWQNRFHQSGYYQDGLRAKLAEIAPSFSDKPASPLPASPLQTGFRAAGKGHPRFSSWRQLGILTERYAELTWRDHKNLWFLMLQPLVIGIVLGLVSKTHLFEEAGLLVNAQTSLLFLANSAIWMGAHNASETLSREKSIYQRERLVNLRIWPYVASKFLVLGALSFLQSFILNWLLLLFVGFPGSGVFFSGGVEMWLTVWLTQLAALAMGLMVSAIDFSLLLPILLVMQTLLAGVIFPLSGPIQAGSYLTIARWSIDSLGTTADFNAAYYQLQPAAGIGPVPAVGLDNFDPNSYDDYPDPLKLAGEARLSRASHLLGRWSLLVGLGLGFLGLTCYLLKRQDRAGLHRNL